MVTKHRTSDVLSTFHDFLGEKFVFWLEVLSVLGAVGDAARALSAAVKWLNEVCLECQFDFSAPRYSPKARFRSLKIPTLYSTPLQTSFAS